MRIWTIQPESLYQQLQQDKVMHANFDKSPYVDWDGFQQAYDWLADEMRERVGMSPKDVHYPFWAWHTLDWQHKQPDLRRIEFRNYSEPTVCIELELPAAQVLLSDEENWLYVLNNWYLGSASNQAEWDNENLWLESLTQVKRDTVKKDSWERIFDVTPLEDEWQRRGREIQTTFWELRLSDVVTVRRFHWPSFKG